MWVAAVAVFVAAALASSASATFPGSNGEIAFTSYISAHSRHVAALNPDGSGLHTIIGGNSFQPDFSSDGRRIVFVTRTQRGKPPVLATANADGTGVQVIAGTRGFFYPAFSADGSLIAASAPQGMVVMNADGTGKRILEKSFTSGPEFSPTSNTLIYTKYVPRLKSSQIFTIAADGSGRRQLTRTRATNVTPSFTPDGQSIVFSRGPASGRSVQIWRMGSDGSNPTQLTDSAPASKVSPVPSPDGTLIAYDAVVGDRSQIFVMNADGSGQTQLTQPPTGNYTPDWQALP